MKIAVNRCFGGFGISVKAFLYLVEKNSPLVEIEEKWGFTPYDLSKEKYIGGGLYSCNSYELHNKDRTIIYTNNCSYEENRTHPDLIEVIELLKDDANGEHAELCIVEIPDDVDWEITEYDGIESVEEKHRRW